MHGPNAKSQGPGGACEQATAIKPVRSTGLPRKAKSHIAAKNCHHGRKNDKSGGVRQSKMKFQISPFDTATGFFATRYYSRSDRGRKERKMCLARSQNQSRCSASGERRNSDLANLPLTTSSPMKWERKGPIAERNGEVRGTRWKCPHLSHPAPQDGPLSSPVLREKTLSGSTRNYFPRPIDTFLL